MKTIIRLSLLLAAVFSMGALRAQNPHFVEGPTNTDNGTTQTTCGKIAGLSNNKEVTITVTVTRTITTQCTNPAGHVAPGQTRTETVSFTKTFWSDKNGNVSFCLSTDDAKPGPCPNGKWTATVTDVSFSQTSVWIDGKKIQ